MDNNFARHHPDPMSVRSYGFDSFEPCVYPVILTLEILTLSQCHSTTLGINVQQLSETSRSRSYGLIILYVYSFYLHSYVSRTGEDASIIIYEYANILGNIEFI